MSAEKNLEENKKESGLSVLEEILNEDITSEISNERYDETINIDDEDISISYEEEDEVEEYSYLSEAEIEKLKSISNLPRITIDAFIERNKTGQFLEVCQKDRRMLRTIINIESGGISSAVRNYKKAPTPNLIIIEMNKSLAQIITLLETLASVCDEGTKVIIIGRENDVHIYRELVSRGVSDYIVSPKSPVDILLAIANIFNNVDEGIKGKSIAFIGAKGGVGASSLAHNIGLSIGENHKRNTLLLDLDLSFGTASIDFEQNPDNKIADFLDRPDRIDKLLLENSVTQYSAYFSMMLSPNTLSDKVEFSTDSYIALIELLKKSYPNVILDLPNSWNEWIRKALLTSDKIVIVASTDIVSFRNVKNMLDFFEESRRTDDKPLLILNQVGIPKRPEISVSQFRDTLGYSPHMVIKWEPDLFGSSTTSGVPVIELDGNSVIANDINNFSRLIMTGEAPQVESEVEKLSVKEIIKRVFKF